MLAPPSDRISKDWSERFVGQVGCPTLEELEPRIMPTALALVITVDPLVTSDTTPELTGAISSTIATIEVTVDGNTYAAVNNGDHTWTLADGTIAPALVDGTYDVVATATAGPQVRSDTTTDELVIQSSGLTVGVDSLTTTDTTPQLTGTLSDAGAAVEVTVDGNTYAATNNGDGTWTLPDNTIAPALLPMDYDVAVAATSGPNAANDTTTDELKVRSKVTLGGDDDVRRATFTDPDGSRVIISLAPARIGEVDVYFKSASAITVGGTARRALVSAANGATLDIVDIVSDARRINVRTRRGTTVGTTIGEITGNATLRRFGGRTADLTGDGVDMTGGVIGNLALRNLQADVTMGAAWARGIVLRIARDIQNSNIAITNSNVRSMVAGAMIDSSALVSVSPATDTNLDNVSDLPEVAALGAGSVVNRVRIKGYRGAAGDLFENANIGADSILNVFIKQAALDNNDSAFGVAANSLTRLSLRQDNAMYRYGQNWLADPDDLTVRVT